MKDTGLRSQRRPWHGEGEQEIKEYHEKLLLQAQNGCQQARESLCQFVYASATKYARTTGLPPVYDLADFAQDVVIEFIEQVAAIQRLRTWLVSVLVGQRAFAYRRFHDHLFERLEFVGTKLDADSKKRSVEEESRQIAHLDFCVLVNQLSEPQRTIVILHCIDSMSFDDVSRTVGMKPSTVRMYFSRSKKRLQKYLNILHGEDSSHGTDT
ncbi:MAG: RNA polymerase sigma factor [bacterium]